MNKEWNYCPICGKALRHKVQTDTNTDKVCMSGCYIYKSTKSKPDVSDDMKIDDFLKEEMKFTDRDLEYRPLIGYWKVVELLQKWRELTKF